MEKLIKDIKKFDVVAYATYTKHTFYLEFFRVEDVFRYKMNDAKNPSIMYLLKSLENGREVNFTATKQFWEKRFMYDRGNRFYADAEYAARRSGEEFGKIADYAREKCREYLNFYKNV